ncbi:hypothetical protein ACHAPI_009372 [Fusarium lateritium]
MKFTQLYLLGHLFVSTTAADLGHQKDNASPSRWDEMPAGCETLASEFPGRLRYDDSDSNFTIWGQKQMETIYVSCVEPASADEVPYVLRVLVDNWCRYGNHSRFPDDSVSIGGVTIDPGLINNTVISEDRTTTRISRGSLIR